VDDVAIVRVRHNSLRVVIDPNPTGVDRRPVDVDRPPTDLLQAQLANCPRPKATKKIAAMISEIAATTSRFKINRQQDRTTIASSRLTTRMSATSSMATSSDSFSETR
jgi:hypothetical protein